MTQVHLRCRCGKLEGLATDVSPRTGNHLICYCDDCQAYAHFLERAGGRGGRSGAILDAHGGTEIFQMTPSQFQLTAGDEHLSLVKLSQKGLMRWFAGCCRTPVANTVSSARVPFVGVPRAFMESGADGNALDDALGPVIGYANARFATGEVGGLPAGASSKVPLGLIGRGLRLLAGAWLAGKNRPSPFFHPSTGAPVVVPQVLTPAEREQLRPNGA
jgi:hypothetical protein